MEDKKIRCGIIDSGKGGKYIGSLLQEQFDVEVFQWTPIFFSSYSDMCADDLVHQCDSHIKYLKEEKVDVVIIGCMTLSTNLVNYITRHFNIPVLDLYTNLPKLSSNTLVIATTNTINSNKFKHCVGMPTPDLSRSIEKDCCSIVTGLLRGYEMMDRRADHCSEILLGCSHYSIVKEELIEYYKGRTVIDPIDYLIKDFKKVYEATTNSIVSNV